MSLSWALLAMAMGQGPPPEDERPILERVKRASGSAAALDLEARDAPGAGERQGLWDRAAKLLEDLNAKEPRHPRVRALEAQASSYRWAIADALAWRAKETESPADAKAARLAYDRVVARLAPLVADDARPRDSTEEALRCRLALAIADRTGVLGPEGRPRKDWERVDRLLGGPPRELSLMGAWSLLRARTALGLGRPSEAIEHCDASQSARPAGPALELAQARMAAHLATRQWGEALASAERAPNVPERPWLAFQARLATPRAPGAEAALARNLDQLRGGPYLARAQRELARSPVPLGPEAPSGLVADWAEGKKALGDLEGAGAAFFRASEVAKAPRDELRLRGAACWSLGPRGDEADKVLTELVAGGGPLAPKAGALRLWARGLRARSDPRRAPGHLAALREQIAKFPNDPTADDARVELARRLEAQGDDEAARALREGVARGSPRWLDARRDWVDRLQERLDEAIEQDEKDQRDRALSELDRVLGESRAQALGTSARYDLDLKAVRRDLSPIVGEPDQARTRAERLTRATATAGQRERARLWLGVAYAALNRPEEARETIDALDLGLVASDLPRAAEALDLLAKRTDAELVRQRIGETLARLAERWLQQGAGPEARLRKLRGETHSGRPSTALNELRERPIDPKTLADRPLADLAALLVELGEPHAAVLAHKARIDRAPKGARAWLDARCGLAEALRRQGRDDEARKIVEATVVLYPELGGGALRVRYEHLRRVLRP